MPKEIENVVTLLDGEVWKQTLPTITGRPPPEAPLLKRLLLAQGELAQFWDDEEGMRYLAFMELKPGTVRGNHFHRIKREFVYVISGQGKLLVEKSQTRKRESTDLIAGDLAMISPGIAHAYHVLVAGQAIEFSPARFNSEDTYPYPLS